MEYLLLAFLQGTPSEINELNRQTVAYCQDLAELRSKGVDYYQARYELNPPALVRANAPQYCGYLKYGNEID